MPVEFDIRGDFATIIDGAEPITLQRRGAAETIAVPAAWRYSAVTSEAETGVAGVARHEVSWQFGWDEEADLPRVGDSIIDAANECWTIFAVEERGAKSRLRCSALNLRIVHQLDDRIEIQQAIWEEGGSGPEIAGWATLHSAVPARIQPQQTVVDHAADPPTSSAAYRIVLADATPLDHNHRLIGPDGSIYRVDEYTQAEQIDALPMVGATKLTSS